MSNNTFYRQPKSTAVPEQANFPELLDDSQWTLAATFSQDDAFSGPSDRIGRYYRQQLDELNEGELEAKRDQRMQPASPLRPTVERTGWAPGLTCRPLLNPLQVEPPLAAHRGRRAKRLHNGDAGCARDRQRFHRGDQRLPEPPRFCCRRLHP